MAPLLAILIAGYLAHAPAAQPKPPRVQLAGITTTGAGAQAAISPGPTPGQLDFSATANSGLISIL